MLGSVRRLGVAHTYKVAGEAAPAPGGLEYPQPSFVHAPAAFTNEVGPMRLVGGPPDGGAGRGVEAVAQVVKVEFNSEVISPKSKQIPY